MKKIRKIVGVLVIIGLVLVGISLFTSPRKVTSQEFIKETLESADDNKYVAQKEALAELVQKYYDCTPQKVVFFVTPSNNYHLELYYKDKDSEWYTTRLGWLSPKISRDLDRLLIKAAMHPQQ